MREWLADMPLTAFVGEHWGRDPIARPSAAASAIRLFDWPTLARILEADPPPDALAVARGRLADVPVPRSIPDLLAMMGRGVGVVVRHAERCDDGLAGLARAFATDLGGEVQLQLFVTPGGTHGFGWHYDVEHVFIAQTAGAKDYYFRRNTVSPEREEPPDFTHFARERSPVATARLIAGDWLYLPARWWHMAKCAEASLSLSIGVHL